MNEGDVSSRAEELNQGDVSVSVPRRDHRARHDPKVGFVRVSQVTNKLASTFWKLGCDWN
jgi:hypothetical protein